MTPYFGSVNNYYPNSLFNAGNSGIGSPEAAFYDGLNIINSSQPSYDILDLSMNNCYQSNSYSNSWRNNMGQAMYNFNTGANQQMQALRSYVASLLAQVYSSSMQYGSNLSQNGNWNNLFRPFNNNNYNNYSFGQNYNARPLSESEMNITTKGGALLAREAYKTGLNMSSTGWCYRGVKNTLGKFGIDLGGGSAYMAANQLSNNKNFEEVGVSRNQLKNLPAGAVVVWDRAPGHPNGHVSVALGDGREASDHIQNQIQNYSSNFRVFMPTA